MVIKCNILNAMRAALLLLGLSFVHDAAAQTRLDELYAELARPDLPNWEMVEDEIWKEWSKSGSPAMDLLLKRARDAMEAGDFALAVEHLTALTDHAPDFAEGYNARASAYFQLGLFGPAVDDLRRALALNPRHFGAMIGLGSILEDVGDTEKALRAFRAALAIHPHEPDLKEAVERLEREVSGAAL
ncbi:tetratricopeptide repeat protein [Actibacterium sp. XHP0104]|uniref:tetratricopeptide repeat protein n=1 Tax=Actibacterium sp. XHP0104 TaxID=2984335 RepID=UPI0021E9A321|nr:tetratricopeptide repeat protein [Actibacterium sp. XHP0104]MCV2881442.1 tetratricopeptide repeat protein [Actibacterium sp. XHP0104]